MIILAHFCSIIIRKKTWLKHEAFLKIDSFYEINALLPSPFYILCPYLGIPRISTSTSTSKVHNKSHCNFFVSHSV